MGVRATGFRHATGFCTTGGRWLGLGLLLLGVLPPAAQAALSSVPDNDWVTNGPVYAMARSGNTIYLSGAFTEVGPRTGPAVTFSGGSSTPDSGFPQVSGGHAEVHAAISDGAGGWYIGGNFTHVGGIARAGLAHIEAGGTVDPNFAPSLEINQEAWSVRALALSGSTLYVGGNFQSISGVARNGLAALSTSDGSVQSFNPGGGFISVLAVSGGTLYVGGSFSELGGQPRTDLAAFTTASNSLTSWAPQVSGTGAQIKALAVSGTQVYLAGSFDHVGGVARNAFAAVDTSGSLSSWNPETSGGCSTSIGYSLAVTGTAVYAGGCFSQIGGQTRNGLAALDPTTGAATSWNPEPNASVVVTLAVSGADIYAGGNFTHIGGQTRNGLAALDATTAEATSWNPNPNVTNNPLGGFITGVNVVGTAGSQVLVGGSFSSVGGVARKDLAAIDATTGEATAWNPGVVSGGMPGVTVPISAISVAGGVVYVGGSFSSVGGQSRTDLAALDPVSGTATSWNPGATSVFPENGHVSALLATPSAVYTGGSFTTLAGRAQRYLGAISTASGAATSWSPVVSAPSPATEHGASPITSLALSGTTLYIGGRFTELGGQGHVGAGAFSTESGSPTAWDPVLKSPFPTETPSVSGLAVAGGTVYLAAGVIGLVAVDASTGATLPWHTQLNSSTLAAANGALYLGAGALDASSGLALVWSPQPGAAFYGPVSGSTVVASGNHVYLAGGFTTTEMAPTSGFAAFPITGPLNTAAPTITGTGGEGQALTEHHGSWTGTPTSYAYQWLRCTDNPPFQVGCTPITGATGPTYTPTAADTGATIEVQETATNAEGSSDPVGSPATVAVFGPPANTAPPVITGTPTVGQTLSCSTGTWTASPTGYQYVWLRDFAPISGATTASYMITGSDAGHDLTCEVTATNAAGSRQAFADAGTIPASGGGGGSGEGSGGSGGQGGSPSPLATSPSLTTSIPPTQAPSSPAHPEPKCVVPNLKHKTLAVAKTTLIRAHCKLGKITKPKRHTTHKLVVVSQKPNAKKSLAAGTKVSVSLG